MLHMSKARRIQDVFGEVGRERMKRTKLGNTARKAPIYMYSSGIRFGIQQHKIGSHMTKL